MENADRNALFFLRVPPSGTHPQGPCSVAEEKASGSPQLASLTPHRLGCEKQPVLTDSDRRVGIWAIFVSTLTPAQR